MISKAVGSENEELVRKISKQVFALPAMKKKGRQKLFVIEERE